MLNDEEQKFNINTVLTKVYTNIQDKDDKKCIEIIFEMDTTIPKELRGNAKLLENFLTHLLIFIAEHSSENEVVLSLSAPEDFLYEEAISFEVKNSSLLREKASIFLNESHSSELKKLDGIIVKEETDNVKVDIPFRIHELGFRRHYRLSDKSMLNKKVLIVCDSENIADSIKKPFEYFNYKVDTDLTLDGVDLKEYDLLVSEDKAVCDLLKEKIIDGYKDGLKCVWIGESNTMKDNSNVISTHIAKPVTQERIWSLIESLYSYEMVQDGIESNAAEESSEDKELTEVIQGKEAEKVDTLDTKLGKLNCYDIGLLYDKELEKFLEVYNSSDIKLRQMVNNSEIDKIEKFCEDVGDHALLIGAMRLFQVVETVKMILIHKQYDLLAIYPGKYHAEFIKLKQEIDLSLKD